MRHAFLLIALAVAEAVPAQVPAELNRAPYYDESDWLEDSLRTTDLVVVGTPREPEPGKYRPAPTSRLDIERILFGAVDRELFIEGSTVRITEPYRFRWDEPGVYILIRTTQGYYSINPTLGPVSLEDWDASHPLLARSAPEPDRPLYEKKTESQIYHYYTTSEWHGTDVSRAYDRVSVELFVDGERVLRRTWDSKGRLRLLNRFDARGDGYSFSYRAGQLIHFAHYRDRKLEGVERRFSSKGQIFEEFYWRNGLRHGPSRERKVDGTTADVVYDDGFVAPVIRFEGTGPSPFRIFKSQFGIIYDGPARSFEVGMTLAEVSEILRLDFSERTGLHFEFYGPDTFLHVAFDNGRVSDISSGWNGLDIELRPGGSVPSREPDGIIERWNVF